MWVLLMKAIPYVIAAAVIGLFYYLWNQVKLWRCAMTGSTEVSGGGLVSESMTCAAQLGLYGLSYDPSTGAVGRGSLPEAPDVPMSSGRTVLPSGSYASTATGNGEGNGDGPLAGVYYFFLPWEEHDMSMEEWCETDLPTNTQRFTYCDISTWF